MDTPGAPEFPESPDAALARLVEGNRRFRDGEARRPRQGTVHRMRLVEDQQPFAVVLACSDSRVSPEVVFDQGLGDLFVVRVAGNTAGDPVIVGSLELGVEVLGAVLILVLGHSGCGAVQGAMDVATKDAALPGDIDAVVAPILPVVERTAGLDGDDRLGAAIAANVVQVMSDLCDVPIIKARTDEGALRVTGGIYELETGAVELLD